MRIKEILRPIFIFLGIDATKNIEYDRLTKAIIKSVIKKDAVCIDIGCHKGEVLEMLMQQAPYGKFFGFEPIPFLFKQLQQKFSQTATIFPFALAAKSGKSTFQHVLNAPAYSGIKQRKYDIPNPQIEEIDIEIRTLDELLSAEQRIDFIKIDVEGGELGVLQGAIGIIKNHKPIIVFECGLGASDYYSTQPETVFELLVNEGGLKINTLKSFVKNAMPLNKEAFISLFETNKEYYFIAYP